MPTNAPRLLIASFAVLAFALSGCGKVKDAQDRANLTNDMKQLGISYLNFQEAEARPPKSHDELNKKHPLPAGISGVTVIWGAGMGPLCKDGAAADIVVAHANAPGGSVLVLMCDGTVKNIAKQEFDSARIAKPLSR
jgi:hypothetical protein